MQSGHNNWSTSGSTYPVPSWPTTRNEGYGSRSFYDLSSSSRVWNNPWSPQDDAVESLKEPIGPPRRPGAGRSTRRSRSTIQRPERHWQGPAEQPTAISSPALADSSPPPYSQEDARRAPFILLGQRPWDNDSRNSEGFGHQSPWMYGPGGAAGYRYPFGIPANEPPRAPVYPASSPSRWWVHENPRPWAPAWKYEALQNRHAYPYPQVGPQTSNFHWPAQEPTRTYPYGPHTDTGHPEACQRPGDCGYHSPPFPYWNRGNSSSYPWPW